MHFQIFFYNNGDICPSSLTTVRVWRWFHFVLTFRGCTMRTSMLQSLLL